jgi:hypothetical protein
MYEILFTIQNYTHGNSVKLVRGFKTDTGAHPSSYPIGIGGSFSRGKAARV